MEEDNLPPERLQAEGALHADPAAITGQLGSANPRRQRVLAHPTDTGHDREGQGRGDSRNFSDEGSETHYPLGSA